MYKKVYLTILGSLEENTFSADCFEKINTEQYLKKYLFFGSAMLQASGTYMLSCWRGCVCMCVTPLVTTITQEPYIVQMS